MRGTLISSRLTSVRRCLPVTQFYLLHFAIFSTAASAELQNSIICIIIKSHTSPSYHQNYPLVDGWATEANNCISPCICLHVIVVVMYRAVYPPCSTTYHIISIRMDAERWRAEHTMRRQYDSDHARRLPDGWHAVPRFIQCHNRKMATTTEHHECSRARLLTHSHHSMNNAI